MASKRIIQQTAQGAVKPLLSTSQEEARRRVIGLYRAWYRQIPYVLHVNRDLDLTRKQCYDKLREYFYANAHVKDVRVIDMLVIKGQMELNETVFRWKQMDHVMKFFRPTARPPPKDFISKFLAGKEWGRWCKVQKCVWRVRSCNSHTLNTN